MKQTGYHTNQCVLLVQLTAKGYVYDKALTGPNDPTGYFNCDAKNVTKVQTCLNN